MGYLRAHNIAGTAVFLGHLNVVALNEVIN